jgi:hypothetical protein
MKINWSIKWSNHLIFYSFSKRLINFITWWLFHLIISTFIIASLHLSIFQHILSVCHLDAQTDRFFWLIKWMMSVRWSRFKNFSCFWRDKILMKSSADISAVEHQLTLIRFVWIFCLNQCLCMSTCFNFVSSFNIFFFNTRRIWRLSQRICNFFIESYSMNSKNRLHQIVFFAIRLRISNFVSMLNVVIVTCLTARQSIESSYNLKR